MRFIIGVVITIAIVTLTSFAEARQDAADNRSGRFVFGAAMGLQGDTPDSTAFAFGFYGDYYLTQEFSIGPLLQIGLTDDLFQLGLTAQAKYTFGIADIPKLEPYVQAGLGIIYADLDRRGWSDEDDTSFLVPLGVGAEYKLTDSVSLDSTFLINITNLDVRDENVFFTWLIGLKFTF